MKKQLALCIFCVLSFYGNAQQIKVQDLDSVTISATLVPAASTRTGRSITTLQAEDIKKIPAQTLDELLRYLPGVEVQARGPKGAQSDILIRGGTFQQVLVIIDGIRVNDPVTGHFNSYLPIAISEIERIEILRGASSVLYGSEAVGGVVQIITKTFSGMKVSKNEQLSLSLGEYNYLSADAGIQRNISRWNLAGGFMANKSNGVLQRGTRGYFNNYTGSASASVKTNNNWNIGVRLAYDSRDFSAQNFYTSFLSDTAAETVRTFWSQALVKWQRRKFSWITSTGFKYTTDYYLFNKSSIANENKSSLIQVQSAINYAVNSRTGIVGGIQFINKGIRSNDRGNHMINQAGAFIALNADVTDYWTLYPALRLEYNSGADWEVLPQLNTSFHFNKVQIRGTAGRTIRTADFTERYNNYAKPLVTGGRIGNPDLTAETAWTYEIGLDIMPVNKLKFTGSVFRRNQQKMIDYISTPYDQMPRKENLSPTGSYALALNVSEVNSSGWEAFVQWKKELTKQQDIWFQTGATWLESKLPDGTKPGLYLSSHANFFTNFSISYRIGKFSISTNGLYKVRTPQNVPGLNSKIGRDYFIINGRADYKATKNIHLFIQADNIADLSYADLLGTEMPGRWVMGGIRLLLF